MTDKKTSVKVSAVYDFGLGHDMEKDKGLFIRLWGIQFECDGKSYKAEVGADEAKALISSDRAIKAQYVSSK